MKYRHDDTQPETLNQMFAMMAKPAPLIEDPVTVAGRQILRIYMDMKSAVLLSDKQPESIARILLEARERTIQEITHGELKATTVAKYDKMIGMLAGGGDLQI